MGYLKMWDNYATGQKDENDLIEKCNYLLLDWLFEKVTKSYIRGFAKSNTETEEYLYKLTSRGSKLHMVTKKNIPYSIIKPSGYSEIMNENPRTIISYTIRQDFRNRISDIFGDLTDSDFDKNVNNFFHKRNIVFEYYKWILPNTYLFELNYGNESEKSWKGKYRKNSLVPKLVDWLNKVGKGTKIDFFFHIGTLTKMKIENGKKMYLRHDGWIEHEEMRGHCSVALSSIKKSGLISHQIEGNRRYIVKGPAFEAYMKAHPK
jgi:hypothetical protein